MPLIGKVNFRQTSKGAEFWQDAEKNWIKINYRERVRTSRAAQLHRHRRPTCWGAGVLAIGAELPAAPASRARMSRSVYRLIDPEGQYAGRGADDDGGDSSALEAAASIAECGGGVLSPGRV